MRIAVAGLSARMMTEAVVRGGDSAIALDLFGDVDTRRAATSWHPIGCAERLQLDGDALLEALRGIAARGDADGWIAGSGFESRPDLLERGAALLPLIGTRPEAQRRLRDPASFFAALESLEVDYPDTRIEPPAQPEGWLAKDAGSSGGWHVQPAAEAAAATASPGATARYWQRQVAGTPMSATFVANGRAAVVLGFNRLLTRRVGTREHVFRGVIGPVEIDPSVELTVRGHIDRLAAAFHLRGLCSLDFMLDGTQVYVLEVNARPPGSMCLYASRRPSLMRAHVRSSLRGRLPASPRLGSRVHGFEIFFAPHALTLAEHQAAALAERGDCHDLPEAGTRFEIGDPLCSVTASAATAAGVEHRLTRALTAIAHELEPTA